LRSSYNRRMKQNQRLSSAAAFFLFVFAFAAAAEDTLETLTVGTNTYRNVRIVQASPVDLLIGHDDGYRRIPLQDLPDSLKAKYPYDPRKAADYQKQKAQEAQLRQARNVGALRTALLAREAELQNQIETARKDLKRINADLAALRQIKADHGAGPADRRTANELRRKKIELQDQIWKNEDELGKVQAQRKKSE